MKCPMVAGVVGITLLAASAVSAQTVEGLSFRPFVMASEQQFEAQTTFEAAFGRRTDLFFGGGLNITQDDTTYLELTASQFKKTGQQAFLSDGQIFRLGIPMTATITPFEATAGYRFHRSRRTTPPLNRRPVGAPRFIPYVGGGVGLYRYRQTSAFATAEENVDTKHAGVIVEGGVEVRVIRWIGIGLDARFTHVPGILGSGGISEQADERNLGGVAGRFKLIVGR